MKRKLICTLTALCATASADAAPDAAIVTDPNKILNSATYDLGDRLLTVQELAKEAMPLPSAVPPVTQAPVSAPRLNLRIQNRSVISIGVSIYKSANQPTRSFITCRIPGQLEAISFWSSADWSLIAGIGNLTAPDGKVWQLMCMPIIYSLEREIALHHIPAIPAILAIPAGASTWQVVSGSPTPEQMAPIALFHAYYDAHLAELKAAQQTRIAEQQRLAAQNAANPPEKQDITVQYRILAPEEIVTPENTSATSGK